MKEKILYLVIGLLIGGMLTTGVFMLINKNNGGNNNNSNWPNFNSGNGPMMMDGEGPTQEQLDSMIRTDMGDGSVRYQSPDGGMMLQRREE